MRTPTHYTHLPLVYDRWQHSYGKEYSTLIFPRLLATLRTLKVAPSTMVDVACGTGSLALMLAKKGWNVWGIDGSEKMIAQARAKFTENRRTGSFLVQDMRQMELPEKVSLATSFYDSLNHLTLRGELVQTLRRVHETLDPRGYFIFDVNNKLCFETLWRHTQVIDEPEFTLVLKNSFNAATHIARSDVTIHLNAQRESSELRETVFERWYSDEELRACLQEAGFHVVQAEDFNFTSVPQAGKIKTWWVGRKVG